MPGLKCLRGLTYNKTLHCKSLASGYVILVKLGVLKTKSLSVGRVRLPSPGTGACKICGKRLALHEVAQATIQIQSKLYSIQQGTHHFTSIADITKVVNTDAPLGSVSKLFFPK